MTDENLAELVERIHQELGEIHHVLYWARSQIAVLRIEKQNFW
jgi:hypothetical protein